MRLAVVLLLLLIVVGTAASGQQYDRAEYLSASWRAVRLSILSRDMQDRNRWWSPYDGLLLTDSSNVQIDHIVPLKHAHDAGAAAWPSEDKHRFATDPWQLLAVSGASNQAKGAKGPDAWTPWPAFRCQYGLAWAVTKYRYALQSTPSERKAVDGLLAACRPLPWLER